jgi:hypothetical protein
MSRHRATATTDWVEEKIVQVKGRGVAQARLDEKKAEEDEAKEFATRLAIDGTVDRRRLQPR